MSRNMIAENTRFFRMLDQYVADRGLQLKNAGANRWIATDPKAKNFLKNSVCNEQIRISGAMAMARFDLSGCAYIITSGFEFDDSSYANCEVEVDGGILVAAINEMKLLPSVGEFAVKNVVEVGDQSDPAYKGHDAEVFAQLFPKIQCFQLGPVDQEQSLGIFFLMCLDDVRTQGWMGEQLRTTLRNVVELSPSETPYATLCRSVFDHDPASLFLAIYRCLEGLYAWSLSKRLLIDLGLKVVWRELAEKLENQLGWRPREEQSLISLLELAEKRDLQEIIDLCGGNSGEVNVLADAAGKRIYALRNSLVHYRPIHQSANHQGMNWNRICELMALVAFYIYSRIVEGETPASDLSGASNGA